MISNISHAEAVLLQGVDLTTNHLQSVLAHVMRPSMDSADIYLQQSQSESWSLEDGMVKSGDYGVQKGFGLRALCGVQSGYAYSDNISLPMLQQASRASASIIRTGGESVACLLYTSPSPRD